MKKLIPLYLIFILALLQSCSITGENTYYKDATSSMIMTIDMQEALDVLQSMGDSSSADIPFNALKYPTVWKSIYQIGQDEAISKGEKFAMPEDSAKILKKIYTRQNLDEKGEMKGFSIKYEKLTNNEVAIFAKSGSKSATPEPFSTANFTDWDGHQLVIKLDELSTENLIKGAKMDGVEDLNQAKDLFKMFKMQFSQTFKFEQDIKKIDGRHDWITQLDKRTVKLIIDMEQLSNPNSKQKYKDSKIVIITE